MRAQRYIAGLAGVAGLLGAMHIALTPVTFSSWNLDALWFLGSGLAISIAALANFISLQSRSRNSRFVVVAINLMMAAFFIAAWYVLPGPQVIMGGVLFLALAVGAGAMPGQPEPDPAIA